MWSQHLWILRIQQTYLTCECIWCKHTVMNTVREADPTINVDALGSIVQGWKLFQVMDHRTLIWSSNWDCQRDLLVCCLGLSFRPFVSLRNKCLATPTLIAITTPNPIIEGRRSDTICVAEKPTTNSCTYCPLLQGSWTMERSGFRNLATPDLVPNQAWNIKIEGLSQSPSRSLPMS